MPRGGRRRVKPCSESACASFAIVQFALPFTAQFQHCQFGSVNLALAGNPRLPGSSEQSFLQRPPPSRANRAAENGRFETRPRKDTLGEWVGVVLRAIGAAWAIEEAEWASQGQRLADPIRSSLALAVTLGGGTMTVVLHRLARCRTAAPLANSYCSCRTTRRAIRSTSSVWRLLN